MSKAVISRRTFAGVPAKDRAHAIAVFQEHIRQVVEYVPRDRLLVYDVASGWQPLCEFLGVPVPEEPFPHANDSAAYAANDRRIKRKIVAVALGVVAALVTLLAAAAWI